MTGNPVYMSFVKGGRHNPSRPFKRGSKSFRISSEAEKICSLIPLASATSPDQGPSQCGSAFKALYAGIDTSNIVEGGRRSRARVDYSAVLKSRLDGASESEDEVRRCGRLHDPARASQTISIKCWLQEVNICHYC